MAGLTDENELFRYLGGALERAFADAELADTLAGTGLVLRVQCTMPDAALVVDLPGYTVHRGAYAPEVAVDLTVTMSGEDMNRFWQGRVELVSAIDSGAATVQGPVPTLEALSWALSPIYRRSLAACGRADLLEH